MSLIGKSAPNFELQAVVDQQFRCLGKDDFRGRWLVVLFYPLDFTFVCPTELCAFSDRVDEFRAVGADVVGVSVDSQFTHLAWTRQPREQGGVEGIRIPLLADLNREMCQAFGVLNEEGVALRGLFVIDPDGMVQQATINNLNIGRSVDETLRVVQACQFARESGDVCPADWRPGDDTIKPNVEDATRYFEKVAAA
jgi:alkyl hydroperoxide reductase subunit AhpC